LFRAFFIFLSESRLLRRIAERSRIGRRLSRRFVAGTELQDALDATSATNSLGMSVSIDNLGENVTNAEESKESAKLYHELLDEIANRKLDANVSLKLTHMGLDVDPKLCEKLVCAVVDHANRLDNFVRIDMEESPRVDATLRIYRRLRDAGHDRVGVVLQAYLYRSERDLDDLLPLAPNVRIVKGAYLEPADVAHPRKADVDRSYVRLAERALLAEAYTAIATHDERIIRHVIDFTAREEIPAAAFEFQMLLGVRPHLQADLARQGYRVRVAAPHGPEWYPYLMRRLAERPANVLFVARNLMRR
jgi:proline dehydrogenase